MMTRPSSSPGGASSGAGPVCGRGAEPMRWPSLASAGMASIEIATAATSVVASARATSPPASAAPIITKPNSPPGPEQHRHFGADARRQPEAPCEPHQDEALGGDQRRGEAKDEPGPGDNERRIDLGPDGDEVEPEEQTLKPRNGSWRFRG